MYAEGSQPLSFLDKELTGRETMRDELSKLVNWGGP